MEQAKRRTWLSRSLLLVIPCCALFAALSSCAEPRIIGTAVAPEDGGTFSPLAPIDASASDAEAELIAYCPSNKCPPGWTTCPNSRFPCDVNLLADPTNCGACGMACPAPTGFESFACVEGSCALQCSAALGALDCDGLVDDGCETDYRSNLHCGACGNECPAGTKCVWQDDALTQVGCGCPAGKIDCGSCVDPTANDVSCGACGNACDPTGGGAPEYPNMYYGCLDGTCGQLKCDGYFLNCDSKIENGCETPAVTDENCGGCGNACPAGQHCFLNLENVPECMCNGDLTFCRYDTHDGYAKGACTDVSSDVGNCGQCGVNCMAAGLPPGARRSCDFGACVMRCLDGHADCNGNEADGCEIDTRSDPRNCGGCGMVCDAVAGQACVAGKCVVEPCDQVDAGEVAR